MSDKRDAPATHRNREPLLAVLRERLPEPARVLEIASGTGQHAVFFAEKLPHLVWQPSEHDPELLASVRAWAQEAALPNLREPLRLDATEPSWPVEDCDALFNANMIHIAPWSVALGLFAGAGRTLRPGAPLFLYGPFAVDGRHTAASNASFDGSLRARDPRWGVRDLGDVRAAAEAEGLELAESLEMPANNRTLVFRRR